MEPGQETISGTAAERADFAAGFQPIEIWGKLEGVVIGFVAML
ncbi:MAG: hypothetical protein ACRD3N_09995 [Terracidiphilus sp.]